MKPYTRLIILRGDFERRGRHASLAHLWLRDDGIEDYWSEEENKQKHESDCIVVAFECPGIGVRQYIHARHFSKYDDLGWVVEDRLAMCQLKAEMIQICMATELSGELEYVDSNGLPAYRMTPDGL